MPNVSTAVQIQDALTTAPPTDYAVTVTSDGRSETVTITATGTGSVAVSASTSQQVQTYAEQQAMKLWQDRVARSWMASTTSATITLGSSWHISTTSATTGTYNTHWLLDDRCTTASNAAWKSESWQNCKHSPTSWYVPAAKRTPEQIAEAAAQAEIRRQAAVIEAAKVKVFKDAANARARRLLVQMLNADQKKELEEKNQFHLTVHDRDGSMRVYRIEYGFQGNVKLLGTNGQPVKRYCIHADSRLPYEDQMLAQKMLLEANEPEFLRIANMAHIRAAA